MRGLVPPSGSMPAVGVGAHRAPQRPRGRPVAGDRVGDRRSVGERDDAGRRRREHAATHAPLARSGLSAVVFRELIGFRVDEPCTTIRDAQAELDALTESRQACERRWCRTRRTRCRPPLLAALGSACTPMRPLSIHLGESAAEVEFLRTARGPWREVLEAVGAGTRPGSRPVRAGRLPRAARPPERPAARGPRRAADRRGARSARRGRRDDRDLPAQQRVDRRRERRRSSGFYASGARVAIGTDSLASVESLSMFDEMAAVRRLAPEVPRRSHPPKRHARRRRRLWASTTSARSSPASAPTLLAVRLPPRASMMWKNIW